MAAGGSECAFITDLINAVQENTCLYDKKDPSYYNKLIKLKSWESIAEKCHRTTADCRNKWKSLRERYARELRKIEMVPETAEQDEWLHFQKLEFLRDSMTSRRAKFKEDSLTIPLGNNDNAYASMEDTDFDEQFAETCSSSTPMSLKIERNSFDTPRKRPRETASRVEDFQLDPLAASTSDELFAKSIVCLMKDLPVSVKDAFQLDVYQQIFQLRAQTRED